MSLFCFPRKHFNGNLHVCAITRRGNFVLHFPGAHRFSRRLYLPCAAIINRIFQRAARVSRISRKTDLAPVHGLPIRRPARFVPIAKRHGSRFIGDFTSAGRRGTSTIVKRDGRDADAHELLFSRARRYAAGILDTRSRTAIDIAAKRPIRNP